MSRLKSGLNLMPRARLVDGFNYRARSGSHSRLTEANGACSDLGSGGPEISA
jgi:hypothetical protein